MERTVSNCSATEEEMSSPFYNSSPDFKKQRAQARKVWQDIKARVTSGRRTSDAESTPRQQATENV